MFYDPLPFPFYISKSPVPTLLTAYCLLLTAYCLLPTAYWILPTEYCLLPTYPSLEPVSGLYKTGS